MSDEYSMQSQASSWQSVLPISRNLYYGGNWHAPVGGEVRAVNSPEPERSYAKLQKLTNAMYLPLLTPPEMDFSCGVKSSHSKEQKHFEKWLL